MKLNVVRTAALSGVALAFGLCAAITPAQAQKKAITQPTPGAGAGVVPNPQGNNTINPGSGSATYGTRLQQFNNAYRPGVMNPGTTGVTTRVNRRVVKGVGSRTSSTASARAASRASATASARRSASRIGTNSTTIGTNSTVRQMPANGTVVPLGSGVRQMPADGTIVPLSSRVRQMPANGAVVPLSGSRTVQLSTKTGTGSVRGSYIGKSTSSGQKLTISK